MLEMSVPVASTEHDSFPFTGCDKIISPVCVSSQSRKNRFKTLYCVTLCLRRCIVHSWRWVGVRMYVNSKSEVRMRIQNLGLRNVFRKSVRLLIMVTRHRSEDYEK